CSWLAPEPTPARPRTRCARCALLSPTPSRATSTCPYSQRRPTSTRRSSTRRLTPWSTRSRTSSTGLPDQRSTARRIVHAVAGLSIFGAFTIFDFNRQRTASADGAGAIAASIFLDTNVFPLLLEPFGGSRE